MAKNNYRVCPIKVIGTPAFSEASKEELRTLIALIQLDGRFDEIEELAKAAEVSLPRCRAALAFWLESGIVSERMQGGIIEEFEERLVSGEIDEEPAVVVAEKIRDENLAMAIDECASLMGVACLPNADIKNITALNSQYKLSAEYIVVLAAHLMSKGGFTIRKLCNKAIRLSGEGYDSVEKLEKYIKNLESDRGVEWEFRRVLGIYDRNLSNTERELFKKWSEVFGYSTAIVSEAYDIAVINTKNGRGDLRYMDAVLTSWHDAGCKTVSECRAKTQSDKLKKSAESTPKKKSKTQSEPPRYGDFDIYAAFDKAVERSFGSETDREGDE